MKTYKINTDPKNCDSDGSPVIIFQCETFELSNGEMHTRFLKMDCSKEHNGCFNYDNLQKWENAIKRARKQFAAFN